MKKKSWMAGAAAVAVVVAMGAIAWLNQPQEEIEPKAAAAGDTVKAEQGCQIVQTMTYSRCEHTVTRRMNAPTEVIGKTLEQVKPLYEDWSITEFGAKEIDMSRELDLYCPDHMVLMPDNAGMLCVFQNKYGDAMALVQELGIEIGALPTNAQDEVRKGIGFATLSELEQWLENAES